ncbi:hypothetical protein CB1_000345040 [Camelus ferus]|nr:hypothetical protein CB1_000345040 [Camelus ferus]
MRITVLSCLNPSGPAFEPLPPLGSPRPPPPPRTAVPSWALTGGSTTAPQAAALNQPSELLGTEIPTRERVRTCESVLVGTGLCVCVGGECARVLSRREKAAGAAAPQQGGVCAHLRSGDGFFRSDPSARQPGDPGGSSSALSTFQQFCFYLISSQVRGRER